MSWRDCRIGEFITNGSADVQTGPFGTQLKASDYVPEGTPVINVRNLGYGDLRPEKLEYVANHTADRLRVHFLEENDIVFGRKGAVDRHLFVTKEQENWMQGSDCIRLRFSGNEVYPHFISYTFLQPAHQQWMLTQSGNKATMASLNQDIIGRIPVRLPLRIVQESIVKILSTYDDAIGNNRRRMGLLEKAARLLYEEWFVRLRFPGHKHTPVKDGLPKGWEQMPLGVICPDLRVAANPAHLESSTPYIGLEHMPRRSIALLDWGKAEDVTSTKLHYQAGDILFGKIRPYFHKVGFALTGGVTSSDAIVLRPVDSIYYSFSLLTVSSDWFVTIVSKTAKEGSKMPRADWKLMAKQPLMIPPRSILESFNDAILPMLEQLRNLAFQNQKLRAGRDLLLPRLMSGEIEV